MSKYFVDGQDLTDIADAIREKTGKSVGMEFPDEFVSEIESISSGGITPTGTINITQNGTTDVTEYASANVAVPNSYAAADEGKVVSNGALVAQSNTSVSANGTYDTTMNKQVTVAVPASAVDSGTKNITANGNNQDVVGYATVNVNVPNSYGSSDEGKVVSNGALVAQGSDTVTQNGTVDTTLISSLIVNVSGGGGSGLEYETGTWNPESDTLRGEISFTNSHTDPPFLLLLSDVTSDGNPTNAIFQFGYFDPWRAFGGTYPGNNSGTYYCGVWYYSRTTANPSYGGVGFGANSDTTSDGNASYPRYWVSTDKFHPGMSNNSTRYFYANRTYKWYAVWKPST